MIGGVLAKFAGPKILLGVLIAAALALGFMWWMYSSAAENAAQARADADRAADAADANKVAAEAAAMERQLLDDLVTERAKRERRLQRQLAQTHDRLEEAQANASKEVRRCLGRRLPGAMLDQLRAPNRDRDRTPPGGAPQEPDPAGGPAPAPG